MRQRRRWKRKQCQASSWPFSIPIPILEKPSLSPLNLHPYQFLFIYFAAVASFITAEWRSKRRMPWHFSTHSWKGIGGFSTLRYPLIKVDKSLHLNYFIRYFFSIKHYLYTICIESQSSICLLRWYLKKHLFTFIFCLILNYYQLNIPLYP